MWIAIALLVALLVGGVLWQRIRNPGPAFTPLDLPDNEPRMLAAVAQARGSLPRFLELAAQKPERASVRLPLATSSGHTEHLWAELIGIDGEQLDIRLITPPTTHTGEFARVRRVSVTDVDDWQVETDAGSYLGGFTMRVMFVVALEQWGILPQELEQLRSRYSESEPGAA